MDTRFWWKTVQAGVWYIYPDVKFLCKSNKRFGNNIMSSKILTMIIAALMVTVTGAVAFADNSNADETDTGNYSVYAYNGSSWSSDLVWAYDAAQAVQNSTMWNSTTDSMVAKYTPGTWVTYNWSTYGNITTFMGLTNGDNVWNVFVKVGTDMVKITDNLGSYKCYSDYNAAHQTANIYLYYGASTVTAATVTAAVNAQSGLVAQSSITAVTQTSEYAYTFNLSIDYGSAVPTITSSSITAQQLYAGYEVTGYGSDAFLALKSIVGSDLVAEENVPGSGYSGYSWFYSLFGLETVQTSGQTTPDTWEDDTYAYWVIADAEGAPTSFVLGAYSSLSLAGTDFTCSSFIISYCESNM